LVVELMTVDINKGEIILGKRFTRVGDIKIILRRYADLLLQAYTGKPGIFSSKLAFVGRRQKGDEKQIFISDFDGSNLIQVTKEKFIHLSPNWSPDGKKLVFTSFRSGNPDLYTYDLTNGTVKVLSNSPGMNSGGAFTPDGSQVAFTGAIAGDTDIFLIDAKGGQRKAFIQGQGLDVDPAFSPDGKYIAYVSGRYGNPHIFLGELTKVNNQFRVVRDSRMTWQGWYNTTPSWTYDSAKIAFAGYDREIDRYDIFIMNPDSKKQQLERLTIRSGDNESPSWSPNGQLLVFQSNRSGDQNVKSRAQLWVMNRDGSHQRKLDIGLYEVFTPKWGPQIED
jgi:TolB protein